MRWEGHVRYWVAALTAVLGVLLVAPSVAQSRFLENLASVDDAIVARLSPDGTTAALVSWDLNGSGSQLVLHHFTTGERRVALRHEDRRLESCAWKTNEQLLCSAASNRGPSELFVVRIDGSTPRKIGWAGRLLNLLPDDAERVTVERAGKLGHLELATGKFRSYGDSSTRREVGELYRSRSDLGTPYGVIDGTGTLRVRPGLTGWLALPDPSGPWVIVHPYEYSGFDLFQPVAFDGRSDELLYIDSHEGRTALFGLHMELVGRSRAQRTQRLVLAPAFAYVFDIETLGKYPRPANAVVFDGQLRFEPVDSLVERVHDTVQRAFPDDIVNVFDEDWSRRHYLVRVTDRAGVGRYQRFDSMEQQLDDLGPTRQGALTKMSLPRTRLEFVSAGGRKAVAYLTAPPHIASPRPIVLLPAGATTLTDRLVPLLTTSGYAVLELPLPPALTAAVGIDLQATVDDIGPAIEALAETHSADTTRVCAVGIEYGAYVALVHAAQDRSLLRCVVGIETVVNPEWREATSLLFEAPPMSASVLLLTGLAAGGVPRLNKSLVSAGVDVELVEYARTNYSAPKLHEAVENKLREFLEIHLH
jgi:hypothetical protein